VQQWSTETWAMKKYPCLNLQGTYNKKHDTPQVVTAAFRTKIWRPHMSSSQTGSNRPAQNSAKKQYTGTAKPYMDCAPATVSSKIIAPQRISNQVTAHPSAPALPCDLQRSGATLWPPALRR
jgi:hypothetical protein